MKHSTERILTTHAGAIARPEDLQKMLLAKNNREAYNPEVLASRVQSAVVDVVKQQADTGLAVINDGEFGKPNFSSYVRERIGGFEERPVTPGDYRGMIFGRDLAEFPEYFNLGGRAVTGSRPWRAYCNQPLQYIGQSAVQTDIANFKAALQGVQVEEAFLPAVAPGTIEHWLKNDYYPNDEAYLEALADTMHEEYKAIADAGFILQIDDPDLPDGWQINSHMSVPEYRKFAELRVDALNHALRDITEEQVRLHVCWGSYHGPHKYDIPLSDIVDIILKVRAHAYSIEASNPRHAHEWRVWADVKLPDGKILVPGVVSHCSDFVEHPELVAERLVRYAKLVGRENVIAGSDCGLGPRVGHPKIAWAKFEAMVEGARLASKLLWGRS